MNSKHAVGIHGYILVYSITAKSSFENCKVIREKILDSTGTNWVPIVLVGNKCDLEGQRQVPVDVAQKLAQEWNCVHVEASAKMNLNIGNNKVKKYICCLMPPFLFQPSCLRAS